MMNVRVNKVKWVRKHLMSLLHNYGFEYELSITLAQPKSFTIFS